MLLCSNAILIMLLLRPIMLHFYTKNALVIHQRTYIGGVKTWIIKIWVHSILFTFYKLCWHRCPQYIQDASWFLLRLLQIKISAFRTDVIQVDELEAIGIYIHMVLEPCSCDTQLDHTRKSCIMLALCCDLKAADYAQNYADVIFTSVPYNLLRFQWCACIPIIGYYRVNLIKQSAQKWNIITYISLHT